MTCPEFASPLWEFELWFVSVELSPSCTFTAPFCPVTVALLLLLVALPVWESQSWQPFDALMAAMARPGTTTAPDTTRRAPVTIFLSPISSSLFQLPRPLWARSACRSEEGGESLQKLFTGSG